MVPRSGALAIQAATDDQIDIVRMLWREYWTTLGFSDDFQDFGTELASLPGRYAAPHGRLLLAFCGPDAAGTAAFRRLGAESCEAKRLYVTPEHRGGGIGRLLLDELIREARASGYSAMYGDTLESMSTALRMYLHYGFVEVPAYSEKSTPGAVYLRLQL